MTGAFFLLVVAIAIVVPVVMYLFVVGETADPTVVDRTEGERLAQERGGRPVAREHTGHADRTDDRSDSGAAGQDAATTDRSFDADRRRR